MTAQEVKRYTLEEFDEYIHLPANRTRLFEYIGGEIIEGVSNPLSSRTAARFIGALEAYLESNDIGHVTGADGGYIVSGERYIPDAAFITYARQPELDYEDGYIPNAPDLAVEVLSPSNDDEVMRIKIANYQAAGTIVWAMIPPKRQVEVYVRGQPVKILTEDDALDGGALLPNFKLPVRKLFSKRRSSA